MKKYGILIIVITVSLIVCPMAVFIGSERENEGDTDSEASTAEYCDYNSISVFNPVDNSVNDMSLRDYCIGAVAAEMPASYNIEALKAQALVCLTYSFAVRNGKNDENADISADSSTNQGYITVDEMKEKWGDGFDAYYKKIASAVDSVYDYVITYNGEIISAVFHAISPGKTENASDVWGSDIPYLKSVDSEGDKYASGYSNSVVFTLERVKEILKNENGVNSDDESNFVGNIKKNSNGRVVSLTFCGKEFTGEAIRELFSLRSEYFNVTYDNGYFTFKTVGYGHGVGMSQYGADYMAGNGSTYEEIIKHYYTGVEITKNSLLG